MAVRKVITGYFAVPQNGIASFNILWDEATTKFTVNGNAAVAFNDCISRLDFLDPTASAKPLCVIPCVANRSTLKLLEGGSRCNLLFHF